MSTGGGKKNLANTLIENVGYAANDIGTGLSTGDYGRAATGAYNIQTAGLLESFFPSRSRQLSMERDANDQLAKDNLNAIDSENNAKRERIRIRIEQEIQQRQRTPGRNQTILTPTLVPNESMSSGTLLTGRR